MADQLQVVYLADHPEHLPAVAAWVYDEWGRRVPGRTLEMTVAGFRSRLNRDAVPLTMVAVTAENAPVGTASLYVHDMDVRPSLTPWLASVYVAPERRQRGVGSLLVQTLEGVARRLQIPRLYLFTPDRERFYARLGWEPMERLEYRDEQVVLMTKALGG